MSDTDEAPVANGDVNEVDDAVVDTATVAAVAVAVAEAEHEDEVATEVALAEEAEKEAETVIKLHQFPRGPWAPSSSPFCLKLELYLRMTELKYKVCSGTKMSNKGQMPFLVINGTQFPDSQLAMEQCNLQFAVDLNKNLNETERHTAHAYRILVDEHMCWASVLWRYRYGDPDKLKLEHKLPFIHRKMASWLMQKRADNQGMGLHNREEVLHKYNSDLRCLSSFLDDKDYMMGDDPSELDCSVFAHLAQLHWHDKECPSHQLMQDELKNLIDYLERIKERFWPDWDDVITHGGVKEVKDD